MKIASKAAWSVALTVVLVLAGCSSGGGTTTPEPTAAPTAALAPTPTASDAAGAVTITIDLYEYQGPASVPAGATITVKNMDSQNHTVTSDDGTSFDVIVQGGGSTTFTAPATAGSYPYHCTYHSNMHGTLDVT